MSSSLLLQKTIHDALKADGIAIFDSVPMDASFPYVSFGPSDEIADDAECIEAVEISQQIDVWSRQPGFVEARRIVDRIRKTLHRIEHSLPTGSAETVIQSTRYLRDPDGLTTHAVVTILSTIESAN